MLDLYGTPYTKDIHFVERYRRDRLRQPRKKDLDRDEKENFRIANSPVDRNYRGKHLQIQFTVEDNGAFTTPWTATITYALGSTIWPETVCAENTLGFGARSGRGAGRGQAGFLIVTARRSGRRRAVRRQAASPS